jgi:hypothetical protein
MTATFVLHGFLRGSKGSVPDCPLRSIPIHSAGGARYAFGLPSICLQPVFNLASHSGFTATLLANSCGRIGANRGERLRRSRLAMEEDSIRSSRVLTRESPLASPHLRVLTCESSLASPHALRHADVASRRGKALSLRLPAQRQGKFPNFPPDVQITSSLGRIVPLRTSVKRPHAP